MSTSGSFHLPPVPAGPPRAGCPIVRWDWRTHSLWICVHSSCCFAAHPSATFPSTKKRNSSPFPCYLGEVPSYNPSLLSRWLLLVGSLALCSRSTAEFSGFGAQGASCSHIGMDSVSVPCITELERRCSIPPVGSDCSSTASVGIHCGSGEVGILWQLPPPCCPGEQRCLWDTATELWPGIFSLLRSGLG